MNMMQDETAAFQNKTVDRFNQEKLYIQLTRIFLDLITSGNWQLNQRIPTETDLCLRYGVSKITVRQAINNLVSDGYLTKIQGKGTFVISTTSVVGAAMRTRLTEEMFGKEVKAEKEILTRGVAEPSPLIRSYLKTDGPIYHILGRRKVGNSPAYLDESFIPYAMLPGIEDIDLVNLSLYSQLQERATRKVFKVVQTVEVMTVPPELAGHLELGEAASVLAVHRLLLSSDETPVGYTRFLGRTDRYKFQTEFERIK